MCRWARSRVAPGAAGLTAGCLLLLSTGCGSVEPAPPNLLLVTVDTLRADRLACYGGPRGLGESLCGPGRSGVRFEWALSTAPYTAPSVASILTSLYPSEHRLSQFSDQELGAEFITLASVLSESGYSTAAFVSNPLLDHARRFDRGFQSYDDRMPRRDAERPGFSERVAEDTTDAALDWLKSAERPWFVWIHYQDPHGPYDPPGSWPLKKVRGGRGLRLLRNQSGWRGIPAYQALPSARGVDTYLARYDDEIRYLDRHVARLFAQLDREGLQPGILVTADHGEAQGEDGYYFAHGHSVALDQIRVPLLWRAPGANPPAGVATHPVSLLDVAPTLLRAAGLPLPPSFRGRPLSLQDPRGGSSPSEPRVFLSEHDARVAVIVGRDYYARDVRDLDSPVVDRNSGGRLHALPARSARLQATGGPLPTYRLGAPKPLERALVRFLEGRHRAPASAGTIDPDRREQLRALGYVP